MPASWSTTTVDDGSGTKNKTMHYKVYRPANLTNSATNKAPAVIWLDEQLGPEAIASWEKLAVANRFVLAVYQPGTYQFNGRTATTYFDPVTVPWQPSPIPGCGASGTATCDDKPGLVSFVKALVSTQHIDPKKIFVTGASKGGFFTSELMCSPSTNRLFRGFGIVSANLWSSGPTQDASTNTCRSFNRDSSVMFIAGEADPLIHYAGAVTGTRYEWGQQAGVAYVARHYGCKKNAAAYLGASTIKRSLYQRCARRYRAVGLTSVPAGGHAYAGIDGIQGFNSEAVLWSFWASH